MKTPLTTGNTYKVGDILHHQWYCTMEFPEYFLVTRVTPKMVEVVKLHNRMESTDGCGFMGYETPDLINVNGTKRLCKIRENGKVLIDSYLGHTASLWDGKPKWANHLD